MSCSPKQKSGSESIYKDSVLVLVKPSKTFPMKNLDSASARKTLYDHFRKKGFLIQSELDFVKFGMDYYDKESPNAIDYDSLFPKAINANGSRIISYYNATPFENGRCVVPHYAIISRTQTGFGITNEEFLPKFFAIDSIGVDDGEYFVYGYFYECWNDKELGFYRIELR